MASINELVGAMKSRGLSKTELFSQLDSLMTANPPPPPPADADADAVDAPADDGGADALAGGGASATTAAEQPAAYDDAATGATVAADDPGADDADDDVPAEPLPDDDARHDDDGHRDGHDAAAAADARELDAAADDDAARAGADADADAALADAEAADAAAAAAADDDAATAAAEAEAQAAAEAAAAADAAPGDDAADAVPLSHALPDGSSVSASAPQPGGGGGGGGAYHQHPMSSSERRRLVEELFAQKKQQLAAARAGQRPTATAAATAANSSGNVDAAAAVASPSGSSHSHSSSSRGRQRVAAWEEAAAPDASDATPVTPASARARSIGRHSNGAPYTDPRQARAAAAAAAAVPATDKRYRKTTDQLARELDAERYPFKPKVAPLPDMYRVDSGLDHTGRSRGGRGAADGTDAAGGTAGAGGVSAGDAFLARATQWRDARNARTAQLSAALQRDDLHECTFRPQLNPNSVQLVQHVVASADARRRVFTERSVARARVVELELKRQVEDAFRADCTFEPRINTRSRQIVDELRATATAADGSGDEQKAAAPTPDRIEQLHTGSNGLRRASVSAGTASSPAAAGSGSGTAFTFAPVTNPVAPYMAAAQVYLEQNAFQRLYTKPKSKAQLDAASVAAYHARARSPIRAGASGASSSAQTSVDDDDDDAPRASASSASASASASVSTPASLDDFLARQQGTLARKQARVAQLLKQTAPRGVPLLNKRSQQLVARSGRAGVGGDFSARLAHSTARKQQQLVQGVGVGASSAGSGGGGTTRVLLDEECTFTPLITPTAHALKARTPSELSVGDAARKLTNLEVARLAARQQEMAGVTFKPQLTAAASTSASASASSVAAGPASPSSASASGVGSVLRVTTEPHTYTARVANQRRAQELKRALTQQVRAAHELRECTFQPVVHDSPAYVKAIAAHVKAAKAADAADAAARPPPQPTWK